jgi:hypothetical protein
MLGLLEARKMYVPYDYRKDLKRQIALKAQEARDWLAKNLNAKLGEKGCIIWDENRLGFRTSIVSLSAKPLLVRLHEEVFKQNFAPSYRVDGICTQSVWHGFSEPWDYLRAQVYRAEFQNRPTW